MANGWRSSKVTSDWAPLKRDDYFAVLKYGLNEPCERVWTFLMMMRRDWFGDERFGEVRITQKEVGEVLRMNKSKTSRSFISLQKRGLVTEIAKGIYKVMSPLEFSYEVRTGEANLVNTKIPKGTEMRTDGPQNENSRGYSGGLIGREVNKVIYVNKSNLVSQEVEEDPLAFLDD